MIAGPDGRPTSAKNLQKIIDRQAARLPAEQRLLYSRAIRNAVFMQFMSGDDYIKGGTSLQVRYPFEEGRLSRDIDAAFTDGIDDFVKRLQSRLDEGWEGFGGSAEVGEQHAQPNMPEGERMTSLDVRITYKGRLFASLAVEAVPDMNGVAAQSERRMDEGVRDALSSLGFDIQPPREMNLYAQLADKLHALSRPGVFRGRDLSDVAQVMAHEDIDYPKLREAVRHVERVQGQHDVHMLDENERERYRDAFVGSFKRTSPYRDFDECWNAVQGVLRQVDADHENEWKPRACPDPNEMMARLEAADRTAHGRQGREPKNAPGGIGGRFSGKR
jgi:hypothetical protein